MVGKKRESGTHVLYQQLLQYHTSHFTIYTHLVAFHAAKAPTLLRKLHLWIPQPIYVIYRCVSEQVREQMRCLTRELLCCPNPSGLFQGTFISVHLCYQLKLSTLMPPQLPLHFLPYPIFRPKPALQTFPQLRNLNTWDALDHLCIHLNVNDKACILLQSR